MTELAIIVPTRGRPENVRKVLRAWNDTGAWSHADLVVVFDADDPEALEYEQVVAGGAGVSSIRMDQWVPMVHKLDQAARAIASDYRAIGFAGDDHLPRTPGWAKRYLDELRELGTGIVYGDDLFQGANCPTQWAMTSDIVRELGRMVPAPVEHQWCDVAILDLGRAAGNCIRYLPDVVIEHMHPITRKVPTDEQYERVNSRQQMGRDRAIYQRWRRLELPQQATAVRRLRGDPEPGPTDRRAARRAARPVLRSRPSPNPSRRRVRTVAVPYRMKRIIGLTPEDVCLALADLAAQVPGDQAIVEIGVHQGKTALYMGWGARSAGQGAHVWAVDPWEKLDDPHWLSFVGTQVRARAEYNVKALGYGNQVTLVQAYSADAAREWSGPPIGLLYVDGDHRYESAMLDLVAWAPHLAEGATVAFDDYTGEFDQVIRAVDDMVRDGVLTDLAVYHGRLAVAKLARVPTAPPDRIWLPDLVDPDKPIPDPGPGGGWTVGPVTTEERLGLPLEPAGKTEPTTPDEPPAAPDPEPEPAGKTEPVDLDPAPDQLRPDEDRLAIGAREIVDPSELEELTEQTTLEKLNVAQLRRLAQVRRITLGRDRKTRDAALAALRAGA